MTQTPTNMSTTFTYDTNTSGEMVKMTTQYAGSLFWTHTSSPAYPGNRTYREVTSRQLVKQAKRHGHHLPDHLWLERICCARLRHGAGPRRPRPKAVDL